MSSSSTKARKATKATKAHKAPKATKAHKAKCIEDGAAALVAYSADPRIQFLVKWRELTEWHVRDDVQEHGKVPVILDFVDSVLELHDDASLSVARLGDGELGLATGATVPNNGCQAADGALQEALQRVLRCDNPKCRIALPKSFFYTEMSCVPHETENFVHEAFLPDLIKGDYLKYMIDGYKYLDGSLSVVKKHYPSVNRRVYIEYYSLFADMLRGRDVLVVTGDTRCLAYEKNLLQYSGAGAVTILAVPQQGAWKYYDDIKRRVLDMNASGDRLVCLGCGPTATVLAYELSDKMRCLDVGHMFGDYNLAMEGAELGAFWA